MDERSAREPARRPIGVRLFGFSVIIVLLAALAPPAFAATGDWTWVSGANAVDHAGVYGTKGTPDPANVPGAREGAVSWVDDSGSLWLFGGEGYDSASTDDVMNDLWHYEPGTGQWTWMSGAKTVGEAGVYGTQGVPNAANVPGARAWGVSWIDDGGSLWLFGGYGYDSTGTDGELNDLWRYDPATNQWTWIVGSDSVNKAGVYGTKGVPDAANVPGARDSSISWVDEAGSLWLFGGWGYDVSEASSQLNDLWRYDPATDRWTWISGSDSVNQAGVYGTKGVADPANVPGARLDARSWIDDGGSLWLFGGWGYDSTSNYGVMNDLWRYDPMAGQWTWMSGANTRNQPGIYGTKGVADPTNVPGARQSGIPWIDGSGSLWLFGGYGYDSTGSEGELNDLWRYDPATNQWAWISGSDARSQPGVYGLKGVADSANVPGARGSSVSWSDDTGSLWLFGGNGYDSASSSGLLNDLWRYELSVAYETHVYLPLCMRGS